METAGTWQVFQLILRAVSCEKDRNRTIASSHKGDCIPTRVPKPVPSINSGLLQKSPTLKSTCSLAQLSYSSTLFVQSCSRTSLQNLLWTSQQINQRPYTVVTLHVLTLLFFLIKAHRHKYQKSTINCMLNEAYTLNNYVRLITQVYGS